MMNHTYLVKYCRFSTFYVQGYSKALKYKFIKESSSSHYKDYHQRHSEFGYLCACVTFFTG